MKRQVIISFAILAFLTITTIGVILYGRGYRFNFLGNGKPAFLGTGLLVTTSTPDGAQVFVNDHLTTATDNTINLAPGEYTIRIYKDGYFPWTKKMKIQKEVVSKADALLFPTAPALESITTLGVLDAAIDPSGNKIAYTVASQSARKNGIYVLDMTNRPILTLQSSSKQVADDTLDIFSSASLSWTPNGQEIIASVSAVLNNTTYLLEANTFNQSPRDVTQTLINLQSIWDSEKAEKQKAVLGSLRPKLRQLLSENFKILAWSPDETRILYEASQSAALPVVISPRLVGVDVTPEDREIKKGSVYVYDIKEDKNYKLLDTNNAVVLRWLPDSKHMIYVYERKIDIFEYDGTNQTTIYAGPFIDGYVYPWPNANRIVIVTNLGNPSITPNLYTINLK